MRYQMRPAFRAIIEVSPEYVGAIVGKSFATGDRVFSSGKVLNRARRVDRAANAKFYKQAGYKDSFVDNLGDLLFSNKKFGNQNKRYTTIKNAINTSRSE